MEEDKKNNQNPQASSEQPPKHFSFSGFKGLKHADTASSEKPSSKEVKEGENDDAIRKEEKIEKVLDSHNIEQADVGATIETLAPAESQTNKQSLSSKEYSDDRPNEPKEDSTAAAVQSKEPQNKTVPKTSSQSDVKKKVPNDTKPAESKASAPARKSQGLPRRHARTNSTGKKGEDIKAGAYDSKLQEIDDMRLKSNKKTTNRRQSRSDAKTLKSAKKSNGGLPSRKHKRKKFKAWQKVLIVLLIIFAAGVAGVFAMYQRNRVDISNYTYKEKQKTQIISSDNQVIAELFTENRTYVSLNQIPDNMKNALIATEDSRFYDHGGVDYYGILRSLAYNALHRNTRSQGASTLTQQLARTLFLPDISSEQIFMDSLNRKFKEISIARQLNKKYSKNQILEMYLNETYFGSSAYGIEEAAKTYFGKDIWDCDLAECAVLAGLPQAPSGYAPNIHPEAAKKRQEEVLDRMVKTGYITKAQANQAKAEQLNVVSWDASKLNNQVTEGYEKFVNRALQQYAEAVAPNVMKKQGISKKEAIKYTRTQVASGGYKIYTTINTGMQSKAMDISLKKYPKGSSTTNAIVTLDQDGSVRAYYGGNTEVDMCNTARQPGSNIKPLYYSCAIDKGIFNANSSLHNYGTYGNWTPRAEGGGSTVSLTTALVKSYNPPAAYVWYTLGNNTAVDWMKTMGITTFTSSDYNINTCVGGMLYGIKPIEMAAAFNIFNNNGIYNQPKFVTKVQNSNGSTIFKSSDLNLDTHQVMKSSTASTMKSILRQVVTSGTGTNANVYGTAGKTGTTDNGKDLWFTGMTGNLTTSIWTGNLNSKAIGGYGATSAATYGSYMKALGSSNLIPGLSSSSN
jgi:penicillin-binding protein 1A